LAVVVRVAASIAVRVLRARFFAKQGVRRMRKRARAVRVSRKELRAERAIFGRPLFSTVFQQAEESRKGLQPMSMH
jgi:hypothetical protein